MRKKIFAIGMVVSLLLAVLGGLSLVTAQESSVTRTLPSGAQTAGSTITVSLDAVVGSATYYAIDSVVPTGWTVTSASDAGDFTADPGHVKWVVTAGATDKTYTYTVTIPGDAAGDYAFTGVYAMEGVSSTAIGGNTVVTVGDLPQGVSRTLPSGDQTAGSPITVSLDVVVDSATYYAIDSVVPTGWTVTSASDAGDFTADPGHVKWVVTAGATDKTYTYTVTIPGDATTGGYTFAGVYAMEGVSSTAIGGNTVVTVVTDGVVKVVINEFVSTPGVNHPSEWIELYTLKDDLSLDGWTIEDGTGSPKSLTGKTVSANYLVLYKTAGDFGFALNNLGDTIILKNGTTEVDRVAYGNWDDGNTADNAPAPDADNSTGRYPNGVDTDIDIDDFTEFGTPTPWVNNTIIIRLCGDVAPHPDGNGIVDMGDVVRLLNHVSNPGGFPVDSWAGNCKCTGAIDMGDVILLLNHVGNPGEFPLECCDEL